MLPETRKERSQLRLPLNRSFSEPSGGGITEGTEDPGRQSKRLYNQLHLQNKSGSLTSSQSSVSSCSTSSSSLCSVDREEQLEELTTQDAKKSPAKRCCLGLPLSLPSSPSCESTSLQRAVAVKRTRVMPAEQLANGKTDSIVVDIRPFLSFNASHIKGAINLNCSDRWNRKRLQTGRVALADLATTGEGKEALRRRTSREVIVVDDGSFDCERLLPTSALFIVISALLDDQRDPVLLSGGHGEFERRFPHLCESHEHGRSAEPTITAGCERSPDVESQPTSQILPFLYLGNGRDADDPVTLDRLGISRVLNVTSDLACGKHLRSRGILYKQLPALDSGHQNLRQYFDDAYHFIEEARSNGGAVLVHCHAGISRSPTIAIAYLMRHARLGLVEAYTLVKQRRPIISPNLNFMGQLLEFEQGLRRAALLDPLPAAADDAPGAEPEGPVTSCRRPRHPAARWPRDKSQPDIESRV